ncbi:hypothetical protein ACVFI8_09660 [Agarivorans sp. MS3-6]|uniref:hypothetical protein n=1 Tax=Agarivorans sp. TSD2052 TaxID=2937286 RepID=UPI00200C0445|nr:hypothetical protein [Agarivorans sp. TSD2052]UPW18739.1 hypothetical protein M0C34_00250 [Agarivorans sp. TSD2052]
MLKVIALIALLMMGTVVGLVMFPPPSSQFQDSALASDTLTPKLQAQLNGIPNAASLIWQTKQQSWLIGTLAPQTVLVTGSAQLAYLNSAMTESQLMPLPASGDIADLALVDQHLVGISSDGRLLYFAQDGMHWKFVDKRKWLRGGLHHKTAGLVWNPNTEQFYTCEREGLKRCYRGDRDGQQLAEFDLHTTEALNQTLQQYQVGSMAWHHGSWYLLSPRYSSLLKVDPISGKVLAITALAQPDTAQAIASDGEQLWLLTVMRQQPETVKLSIIPLKS